MLSTASHVQVHIHSPCTALFPGFARKVGGGWSNDDKRYFGSLPADRLGFFRFWVCCCCFFRSGTLVFCLRALFTPKYWTCGFPLPLALIMNPISGMQLCFPLVGKPLEFWISRLFWGRLLWFANSSGTMSPNTGFFFFYFKNQNNNRT